MFERRALRVAAWGNDYPLVTKHDSWFWRNTTGGRVVCTSDGKWLMNLTDPSWASYWLESMTAQVAAGAYDGVFFDSSSAPLIQGETKDEPRLSGTGVKDNPITELGGKTYIEAWESWIAPLDAALAGGGVATRLSTDIRCAFSRFMRRLDRGIALILKLSKFEL